MTNKARLVMATHPTSFTAHNENNRRSTQQWGWFQPEKYNWQYKGDAQNAEELLSGQQHFDLLLPRVFQQNPT